MIIAQVNKGQSNTPSRSRWVLQEPMQVQVASPHTIMLTREPSLYLMLLDWCKASSSVLRTSYLIDSAQFSAFPTSMLYSRNALTPSIELTTILSSPRLLAAARQSHSNLLSVVLLMASRVVISKLSTKRPQNHSAPRDGVTGRRNFAHSTLNVQNLLATLMRPR